MYFFFSYIYNHFFGHFYELARAYQSHDEVNDLFRVPGLHSLSALLSRNLASSPLEYRVNNIRTENIVCNCDNWPFGSIQANQSPVYNNKRPSLFASADIDVVAMMTIAIPTILKATIKGTYRVRRTWAETRGGGLGSSGFTRVREFIICKCDSETVINK